MNELTVNKAVLFGGVAGGVIMSVVVTAIVLYILQVIAGWKIFKKAGEKGWKAIIPIYNTYISFKIVGMKRWFWILFGVAILAGIVSGVTGYDSNNIYNNTYAGANLFGAIVYFVTGIFATVVTVWYYVRLSKAFGHGLWFALGLIFLQPIFLLILGFGSSKYDKKFKKMTV